MRDRRQRAHCGHPDHWGDHGPVLPPHRYHSAAMTLIEEATAYVVGAGSGTSSCVDEFARTDSTRWGDSPICCLPWQASTHGSHSVDGALAHQSGVGFSGGEEPTDWLGLTAWTGTALEFLVKL